MPKLSGCEARSQSQAAPPKAAARAFPAPPRAAVPKAWDSGLCKPWDLGYGLRVSTCGCRASSPNFGVEVFVTYKMYKKADKSELPYFQTQLFRMLICFRSKSKYYDSIRSLERLTARRHGGGRQGGRSKHVHTHQQRDEGRRQVQHDPQTLRMSPWLSGISVEP